MSRGLARVLSKAGVCSRNVAADWIRAGRVRVDGAMVRDPERRIVSERAVITLDGRRIGAVARSYWALHKPRGYVTTRSDPAGRRTAHDLVGAIGAWAIAVGRLDRDTSGLLLFTNDTQFAERVTNPASHVPKTYRATVKPRLPDAALERLRAGVVLSDGPTRPALVTRIGDRGPTSVLELTISEGRNRQVRRMISEVGGEGVAVLSAAIRAAERC